MSKDHLVIFDTTLRDGEQSPGASMTKDEKVRIAKHLENHKILSDNQHGFRAKRSCETQLIQTIEDLSKALNDKQQIDMAILDFSKAFDTVSHSKSFIYLSVSD